LILESCRNLESPSCAARSLIVNRGGGNGPSGEQGDTDRDVSRVVGALLDSREGDRLVSHEKFSSNILQSK